MGHTPLGYKIENGVAVIDRKATAKVLNLYKNYLSGLSLIKSAKKSWHQYVTCRCKTYYAK